MFVLFCPFPGKGRRKKGPAVPHLLEWRRAWIKGQGRKEESGSKASGAETPGQSAPEQEKGCAGQAYEVLLPKKGGKRVC